MSNRGKPFKAQVHMYFTSGSHAQWEIETNNKHRNCIVTKFYSEAWVYARDVDHIVFQTLKN